MSTLAQKIYAYISKRYDLDEYPALRTSAMVFHDDGIFAGRRILDGTPLYTNTLVKYLGLVFGGADLTVGISDAIPRDDSLLPLLAEWGIPVVENCRQGDFDCILDCGGVHSCIRPRLGTVELTRSGYYHYKNVDFPVLMVDDSKVKKIETSLGTGDGFMRGMKHLGYGGWRGKSVVIFGCGKVGSGVAYRCHKARAKVTVVDDIDLEVPKYVTLVNRHDRTAVQNAVRNAYCVVTATGIKGAMVGNGASEEILAGTQLVAALGIEDEWCGELPPSRLLCDGKPVNFILEEPTQLKYIDPTMALSNLAAYQLCAGKTKVHPGVQEVEPSFVLACLLVPKQAGLIGKEMEELGFKL